MPENEKSESQSTGTAVAEKPTQEKGKTKQLPPYKVLLHNDDTNTAIHVVKSIVELTTLNEDAAKKHMKEAHETGLSLLLVTHKERAELYQEQFQSKSLVVTIEPA